MSDEDIPTNGSRWEPADGAPEGTSSQAATPVQPTAAPVSRAGLARGLRGRSAVAAAGVGLVVAGGLGGFAVAHAVTGGASDGGTVTDHNGVPGDGHGGRPDVPGGERPGPSGTGPRDTQPDSGGSGTA